MTRIAAALSSGRAAAESIMTDACQITRVTGQSLDEADGSYTDVTSTIYAGKCRVKLRNMAVAALPLSGERQVVAQQLEVQIPATAAAATVGDTVTVTASAHDSTLVGKTFRVREEFAMSHATARRLVVQEEQS